MKWPVLLLLCLGILSCRESTPEHRAVYVLIDRSGSYAQYQDKVLATIKLTLASLEQGDSFAMARIDNENFSERDILAALTFSSRPSQTNAQKRALLNLVEQQADDSRVGSYTDITGGMLQAITWFNAKGASSKIIIVFSDFPDEPREGYLREFPVNFNGAWVVVWNASQTEPVADAFLTETQSFSDRASAWQARVQAGGGNWKLLNDINEIKPLFH
ncbi:MAG: VWA domain-containing protein [Gammaproteobacteria bacterium]|nr:VWA domain-containing protein [Gammaproteobacteria bacterium]